MQSINFQAELIPLEKPTTPLAISSSLHLEGTTLVFECLLKSPVLASEGLDAFVWEKGPEIFCETLWKKSCFEFFVADAETSRYWEWNFSPQMRWGAFSFGDVRSRCPQEARKDAGFPSLSINTSKMQSGELKLQARVDLSFSPFLLWIVSTDRFDKQMRVSLNAITETPLGERIHWALQHAHEGKPNFHVRAHFKKIS